MTDEELIEALGWEECNLLPSGVCPIHNSQAYATSTRCAWQYRRLNAARAGIDLAKVEITDLMKEHADKWAGRDEEWVSGLSYAILLIRRWQP